MNSILLFSKNKEICASLAHMSGQAKDRDLFSVTTCSDFAEAENLLNNKDFFAVFMEVDLLANDSEIAFLSRHNSCFIGIGKNALAVRAAHFYRLGLFDYVDIDDLNAYTNTFLQTLGGVLQRDAVNGTALKKFFLPDSLEKIILSSLLHEIRNNNNIVSLNAGMLKGLFKNLKDGTELKNSEELSSYLERAIKGTEKTTEVAHMFGHIYKLDQTPMGSVSDFADSLAGVLGCFSNRFKRLYSEVITDDSFKMPYIKINQRDMTKIILNMVYLAGLSLTDKMPVLKIEIFGDETKSGFSLAFPEAGLYQGYFDKKEEHKILFPPEYLASLDILSGFASLYGGSFSFKKEKQDIGKLEFCFSSDMFYS